MPERLDAVIADEGKMTGYLVVVVGIDIIVA